MQTRNATGNLVNRYKAVLKKCNLINVFGTLAVASMLVSPVFIDEAFAVGINPAGSTISTMDAGDGERQKDNNDIPFQEIKHVYNDSVLVNNGTISGGAGYYWEFNFDSTGLGFVLPNPIIAMYGYSEDVGVDFSFTNNGSILMHEIPAVERPPIRGVHISSKGSNIFTNNAGALISIDLKTSQSVSGDQYSINKKVVGIFSKTVQTSGTKNNEVNNNGSILINLQTENTNTTGELYNYINEVHGVYTYGGLTKITNGSDAEIKIIAKTGDITEAAEGAYAHIRDIYGIFADIEGTSNFVNIENKGAIIIDAQSGNVKGQENKTVKTDIELYGIHVGNADGSSSYYFPVYNSTTNNSGTINVYGKAGTAISTTSTTDSSLATADVTGIYVSTKGDNFYFSSYAGINNSGTINVEAITTIGANSADATASGIWSTSDGTYTLKLNNSGIIDVTATAGTATFGSATADATAYGMLIKGSGDNIFLSNTGIINLNASTQQSGASAKMYEAYAVDFIDNTTTKLQIGTWATTLRDWTLTDTVFGGEAETSVNLANSTLILRPGTKAEGFYLGKEYSLENLVSIDNTATPTQLGKITTEVPFIKAVITGGNITSPTTSVRLDANINTETVPGSISAQSNLTQVRGQMSNITRKLLQTKYLELYKSLVSANGNSGIAAGSDMEQNKWTVFATPYSSYINNSEYNFDGSQSGVTAGASYTLSPKFSLGAHFDFNYAQIDADIMDMNSDSTSFAFGLHANYNILPQWYVSAQATTAISQIENDYSLPDVVASSKADYDSQAIYLSLNSGYLFEIANGHTFTPQIGFSYLNMNADSYDIDWGSSYSMYNMEYDSTSYSAFYADLTLNWHSTWQFENNNALALLLSAGIRQNLSGSDVDSDFRTFGTEYSTRSNADDTTFLTDFGLEWSKNNFSLNLNYNGEYGSEQQMHNVSIQSKFMF